MVFHTSSSNVNIKILSLECLSQSFYIYIKQIENTNNNDSRIYNIFSMINIIHDNILSKFSMELSHF